MRSPRNPVRFNTANVGHLPNWTWGAVDELVDMIGLQNNFGVQKPVYYSEPDRWLPQWQSAQMYPWQKPGEKYANNALSAGNLIEAVQRVIQGGGAAWTFHTEGTFKLDGRPVSVSTTELQFLQTFRAAIGWPQ